VGSVERFVAGIAGDPGELAVDLYSAAVDQAEDYHRIAGRFEDFSQLGLALGAPPLALRQRPVALGESAAIKTGQVHRALGNQRPGYHSKPAEVHVRIGRRRQRLIDRKCSQTKHAQPCLPAFAPWNERTCSDEYEQRRDKHRHVLITHHVHQSRLSDKRHTQSQCDPAPMAGKPSAKADHEAQARQCRGKQINFECRRLLTYPEIFAR
jgi:hypothetical protein